MTLRHIQRKMVAWNGWLEEKLGPAKQPIMLTYRECLHSANSPKSTRSPLVLHLGSGRDLHGLSSELEKNRAKVVALDRDLLGLSLNSCAAKVAADGTFLPFAKEVFDLVFSEYVFEHLEDPWGVLHEVNRVLRPDGHVVILVPNRFHYYTLVTRFTPLWFHKLYLRFQGSEATDIDVFPTRYRWGTLRDIRSASTRLGWNLVSWHSSPGPTGYTIWLPFHIVFILLEWFLHWFPTTHVAYVAHYAKRSSAYT